MRSNDMVYGRMVSEDETVALVVAGINNDHFSEDLYDEILAFARSFESEDETIYVAGRPIVEGTMGQLGPAVMKRMVPIVLVVIAVVLFLLLRSIRATTATLLTVFVSTIWAFGLMAVLQIPIFAVSTMIPVMLIAIGVAYGIYFYNHLDQYYQANPGTTKRAAVHHTIMIL
ncbi:MAG: MMPL family transporter [Bacteroidales bacterium]|nr:MMPL family transporter [Bacteroidales bacterium]MDT8431767.1 MMPL family transporter [Bacteroidales bacterium]